MLSIQCRKVCVCVCVCVCVFTPTYAPPPRPGSIAACYMWFMFLYSSTGTRSWLDACQLRSGWQTFCRLQGCEDYVLNGQQPVLNKYECQLVSLTKNISTMDCNQVKCAVSLVHDCTVSCKFEERDSSRKIEQKLTNEKTLHFKHDWSNMMYCFNVQCV